MTRAINRIEKDLAALSEAIATIASEFNRAYSSYLTALGQATRQQLVLACFHLCTQGYPESFLQLSLSQREHLQGEIRNLANLGQQQLQDLQEAIASKARSQKPPHLEENQSDRVSLPTDDIAETVEEQPSAEELSSLPESDPQPMTPEQLVGQQKMLEGAILKILQTLSNKGNRLLQRSSVLPNKLQAPIPEDAKAEAIESVGNAPNLLNLIVETENSENQGGSSRMTQITAIHLRLSEIEFADSTVSAWRTQIRQLSSRLNHLGQQYYQKQQELAIAQAEAAWRSSWFEE